MRSHRVPVVLLCASLAACGGVEDRYGGPDAGFVENPATVTGEADWDTAAAVTVRLSSYEFAPDVVLFRAGRPYALTLVNDSGSAHTFRAPEFFRSIAVRSLTGRDGGAPRGTLETIALEPGEARRLDFVPVRPGTYRVECDRPLHAVFGMTATLRIE